MRTLAEQRHEESLSVNPKDEESSRIAISHPFLDRMEAIQKSNQGCFRGCVLFLLVVFVLVVGCVTIIMATSPP